MRALFSKPLRVIDQARQVLPEFYRSHEGVSIDVQPFLRKREPERKRPRLNLALLYLLVLLGSGIWISRNRLWQQRLLSPLETFVIASTKPDLRLPQLKIGRANRVTHYVRSGEKITTVFHRFGLNEEEAPRIERAILSIQPMELEKKKSENIFPRPGRKISFALSPTGEVLRLNYPVSQGKEVLVVARRASGKREFQARLIETPAVELQVTARGEIRSSFASSAKDARVPYEIIDDIADIFGDRIDFRKDFQKGDRFTLIFRQQMLRGSPVGKAGPIIAAVFEVNGKEIYALRYVGTDGKARYFDQNGKVLGTSFLRFPLQFSKITSAFSDARFHPVLRIKRPHNGVDFAAPIGTLIRTVGDGQVVFAGYKGPNGNMVRIRHNDRYTTEYLHMSRIAGGIQRGAFISKGQVIGTVGSTGLSTGPHLHFGLFDKGKYVDPLHSKLPSSEPLGRGTVIDRKYLSNLLLTLQRHQTEKLGSDTIREVTVIDRGDKKRS